MTNKKLIGQKMNCVRCDVVIVRLGSGHKYCKDCVLVVKEEHRAKYRSNFKVRLEEARKSKEFRKAFPGKYNARWALGNAVRDGKVVREPCLVCKKAFVEGHHEDYSKPLEVMWLCKSCHYWWHKLRPIYHKLIDESPIESVIPVLHTEWVQKTAKAIRKMLKGDE